MKKVALIAHDKKKDNLLEFVKKNIDIFSKFELVGTGTRENSLVRFSVLR